MKKFVKKGAYLLWSHVQEEKNVKWSRQPGMLGFMGTISISLIIELLQLWVLKCRIFGQKLKNTVFTGLQMFMQFGLFVI